MAKIKLGNRPKNFKAKVTFPLLEGGEATIEMSYIYRTRVEFGKFLDEMLSDAGIEVQADEASKATIAESLAKTRDTNAEYILKIADGWDLDIEFNRDTVAQMCDEYPAAAMAVMNQYRSAMTEGRLGN